MNHSASPAWSATSGDAALRTPRITPPPPMPARRSASRRTRSADSSSRPSGSGTSTKSFSVPCPLLNRSCSLTAPSSGIAGRPDDVQRAGEQPRVVVLEPDHAVVAPEPGLLAAGQPPGEPGGLLLRHVAVQQPVELRERLRVTDR